MDADTYQHISMRTAGGYGSRREMQTLAALGLAGETGEVVDLIKKDHFHLLKSISPRSIMEELGDALFYAALLSESYCFTLGEAMEGNVKKLEERYPKGFPK